MIATERDKLLFDQAFWYAASYIPTKGEWPIYNADGALVTTCYGQDPMHADDSEIIMAMGGERAGKSMFTAMHKPSDMLVEGGTLWNIGPNYLLAKEEFRYIYETLQKMGLIEGKPSMPQEGQHKCKTTWNFNIETKSGADPETLAAVAPHRINVVEANQLPYEVMHKVYGRALQHRARIVINGTIEKSYDWMKTKWDEWQGPNLQGARSYSLPSWSNKELFPGGREDPEIKKLEARYGPELFLERCAAIPVKPSGLVHGLFETRKHVKPLPFNDKLPIELAIDPAKHTYAIEVVQWETLPIIKWFERFIEQGRKIDIGKYPADILNQERTCLYVIDEIYKHGMIIQDILPEVKRKSWYPYIKSGTIDIAGNSEPGTKSQVQIWMEETGIPLSFKRVGIEQGIGVMDLRLRNDPILGVPLIYFDYNLTTSKDEKDRANGVLAEFGLYKYPDFLASRTVSEKPIDRNNDGIKALSYKLFSMFGPVIERKPLPKMVVRRYA